jgi:hypothetical protein
MRVLLKTEAGRWLPETSRSVAVNFAWPLLRSFFNLASFIAQLFLPSVRMTHLFGKTGGAFTELLEYQFKLLQFL